MPVIAYNVPVRAAVERGHEELVLCGFSQGACLIAELVVRRPRPYLGVAILTGSLVGPAGERSVPANVDGLPVYISSSRYDEWVLLEDAEATAEAFRRAGANVRFETLLDREHSERVDVGVLGDLSRAVGGEGEDCHPLMANTG
jgi:predicted esterase